MPIDTAMVQLNSFEIVSSNRYAVLSLSNVDLLCVPLIQMLIFSVYRYSTSCSNHEEPQQICKKNTFTLENVLPHIKIHHQFSRASPFFLSFLTTPLGTTLPTTDGLPRETISVFCPGCRISTLGPACRLEWINYFMQGAQAPSSYAQNILSIDVDQVAAAQIANQLANGHQNF